MKKLFYTFLFLTLISCGNKTPQKFINQGEAFGTTYSIQTYALEK